MWGSRLRVQAELGPIRTGDPEAGVALVRMETALVLALAPSLSGGAGVVQRYDLTGRQQDAMSSGRRFGFAGVADCNVEYKRLSWGVVLLEDDAS